jgi:hypothetical protein
MERETPYGDFALCGGRPAFRREVTPSAHEKLLKKFYQNFYCDFFCQQTEFFRRISRFASLFCCYIEKILDKRWKM